MKKKIVDGLNTKFVGKEIHYYKTVKSTQKTAKKLILKGIEDGSTVVSETQTAGKGRRDRSWSSVKGGIYLSIILKPKMDSSQASLLSLLAGVAAAKTIEKLHEIRAELKWPNDVQIKGKKVGGILLELSSGPKRVKWITIGIGLNANNKTSSLPQEIQSESTSLFEELGNKISRPKFIGQMLNEFEELYSNFNLHGAEPVLKEWKKLTSTLGNQIQVTNGDSIEGRAVDVDQNGALLIEKKDGKVKRVTAGDVSIRRK